MSRTEDKKEAAQIAEIARQLKALLLLECWHELLALSADGSKTYVTANGYFNNVEAMARAAFKLNRRGNNVYFGINPVRPAIAARAYNRIQERPARTAKDPDIACRRRLLIDFDPKIDDGISATDAEHGFFSSSHRVLSPNYGAHEFDFRRSGAFR